MLFAKSGGAAVFFVLLSTVTTSSLTAYDKLESFTHGDYHMIIEILQGILLPFWGTSLGAACVFFMRGTLNRYLQKLLTGFAAGVMVAASVWSLLIPAIEKSEGMGSWRFVPAVAGFGIGIAFFVALDKLIRHFQQKQNCLDGERYRLSATSMLVLAVMLHNLPEGMAVGAVYAGVLAQMEGAALASALILSLGIAIQNFPEGAIISMPLKAEGVSKGKAFGYGVVSGIVEPVGAVLTILASRLVLPILPYMLGFAAGAMIYVVVEELIPEMTDGEHSSISTVMFGVGFALMMTLDVALG